MIAVILALLLFLFVAKYLRQILVYAAAFIVAGFIMAPAHAQYAPVVVQDTNTYEYQAAAFKQFALACATTGNPQFCDARDGAYIRALQLRPQAHIVTTPQSRYAQLDEQCRGGHGDDPQTRKACKKRDAMDKAGQ